MRDRRIVLAEAFEDTLRFIKENETLRRATARSMEATAFFDAGDDIRLEDPTRREGKITVSRARTFEKAFELSRRDPSRKIAVLNFASATTPGGGVRNGASAQEESLCRTSTLYPCLDQKRMWDLFYSVNRALDDPLHTDACIYTPGVVICKTDEEFPRRLEEGAFVTVDVITCAAPNLRGNPHGRYDCRPDPRIRLTDEQLYALHLKRAGHILRVCASQGVRALILGAFGCGAFQNDPWVTARAYRDALKEYASFFDLIDFAIYCGDWESENYEAFDAVMNG